MSRQTICLWALLLAVTPLCAGPVCAAPFDFPVHPDLSSLQATAPMADSYDIVFLGDGYRKEELAKFLADATAISTGLLDFGPYADSRWLVNSHALFVPSKQSGADHPSKGVEVDTAFDATYDSFGIEYLVSADTAKILSAAATILPAYDQLILIVNDKAYGGSGGEVAVVSTAPESLAILRHEVAHSVANLADEYEFDNPNAKFEDPEPNVASVNHLEPLKWGHWVDAGTPIPTPELLATGSYTPLGAYEGARYFAKDMFRPAPDCLMRSLDMDFCAVCNEALMLRLAAQSTMIRSRSPDTDGVTCAQPHCPIFEVEVAPLEPLQIHWLANDQWVGTGKTWQAINAPLGESQLVAEVRHSTPAVRLDADGVMTETIKWTLRVGPDVGPGWDAGGADAGVGGEPEPGCTVGPTPMGERSLGWLLVLTTMALLTTRRTRRQGR